MHRSTSSSNSGDNGGWRDLRFRPLICFCKKIAALRIVSSDTKPSKGKLYFTCEKNECNFFKWCEPINQGEASSSSTSVVTSELGLVLAEINENIEAAQLMLDEIKAEMNAKLEKLVYVVVYALCFVVIVGIFCMLN